MYTHLRDHIETHVDENHIQCEICQKHFKTSVTFKNHMRQVHVDEHEYKCGICERGFYRKYRLEVCLMFYLILF